MVTDTDSILINREGHEVARSIQIILILVFFVCFVVKPGWIDSSV